MNKLFYFLVLIAILGCASHDMSPPKEYNFEFDCACHEVQKTMYA